MNKQDVFAIDKAHYMPVFARYPMVISHGEGAYVTDTDGNRYLDFFAGIAVNALGHAHPNLVKAVAEQAAKVIHCSNLYYTEVQAQLIEKLASLSGLDKVFLANSGAEANEGALKLARKYGKTIADDKYEIITANHCFHGRTLMTLTATAQPKYQAGYEPLPQGFTYIDYNDIAALEAAISDKTCAVVLEPIQGEGGVNVPADDYLQKVRALCDKHGALLIFDEVQTGIGRTGKMFAYEHFGVKPDIVTLAKGLAGGVPIGAFLATDKVASAFHPGDHGSTFGGNPLACAASKAVLDTILEDKLLDNVNEVGAYLMDNIRSLGEKYPAIIRSVRGKGFMVGIELTREGRGIVEACLKDKLIINCTAGNVLRLVPSLTIGKQQVDEMITILDAVLAKQ
ncbi:MAG: acetylornithine transaminase [Selenomonadales bacterium]|nr:acetylornithine transaminase [Selenomonadales bacterium]